MFIINNRPLRNSNYGNTTIHVTPPNFKLEKIICIKDVWYKELIEIIKRNFRRKKRRKKKNKTNLKIQEKELINKSTRSYETNNIWATRDSKYWSWIRAKEWFKEYNDDKLINGNEIKNKLKILGVK